MLVIFTVILLGLLVLGLAGYRRRAAPSRATA